MESANALDMLILPLFQCTAGIFAAFGVIHLIQVAFGRLFGPETRDELEPSTGRSTFARTFRPASSRADRAHSRPVGVSR